jgi:prepilin-type N-terminal cleavage/methylation domain-containing protein
MLIFRCMVLPAVKSAQSTRRGFTLVEVFVVVGVLSIMTVAITPSFTSYLRAQKMKQLQENIKSELRSLQNKALTGVGNAAGVRYWGIRFSSNTHGYSSYQLFPEYSDSPSNAECATIGASGESTQEYQRDGTYITTTSLEGVEFSGEQEYGCLFFDMANGDILPVLMQWELVQITNGREVSYICFNEAGMIYAADVCR